MPEHRDALERELVSLCESLRRWLNHADATLAAWDEYRRHEPMRLYDPLQELAVYRELYDRARGFVAESMGWLREAMQGVVWDDLWPASAASAAVEYARTQALDDLQPEPPGVL